MSIYGFYAIDILDKCRAFVLMKIARCCVIVTTSDYSILFILLSLTAHH